MTSGECFEKKLFYMKYIGKYLGEETLLTRGCTTFCFYTIHVNVLKHHYCHDYFVLPLSVPDDGVVHNKLDIYFL